MPSIIKWTDALLSGDFNQGGGFLKTMQGDYCCLGVGCEVLGGKFIMPTEFNEDHYSDNYDIKTDFDVLNDDMPVDMIKKFDELQGYSDKLIVEWCNSLANANDGGDHNFERIAAKILDEYSRLEEIYEG